MANEYSDAWKKAKTAFEAATNKKKPSATVLGIFRKGTGIEGACKALDGATTDFKAKEKAAAAFKTACTSYIDLLNKTANDPKSIKPADKSTYISATISLKLALQAIEKDACRPPTAGEPAKTKQTDAKTQSPDALIKDAKAHIALRKKVLADATALSTKMKSAVAMMNERLAKVLAQVTVAKQAAAQSNTMNHKVAVGVIDNFITEAEGITEKAQTAVDGFAKPGGEFMDARGDMKATFDGIPDPLGAQLRAERDKPWGPVGQMAADSLTQVKLLDTIVQKMHAAKAEAVASGSEGKSVKEYLTDILTLKGEMESLVKQTRIKSDRITQSVEEFDKKVLAIGKLPDLKVRKDTTLKHCQLMEDQWTRYSPEMTALRDRLGAMKTRATSLPRGALDDKAIAKAVAEAGKAADDGIAVMNKQLKDGAALELKIATTRKNNP